MTTAQVLSRRVGSIACPKISCDHIDREAVGRTALLNFLSSNYDVVGVCIDQCYSRDAAVAKAYFQVCRNLCGSLLMAIVVANVLKCKLMSLRGLEINSMRSFVTPQWALAQIGKQSGKQSGVHI